MYKDIYADLHIHIGAGNNGKAVKITASRKLNFNNILKESRYNKGLDMIGIIDSASPHVIRDIEKMLEDGEMEELKEGGIKYGGLLVVLGAEIESREDNGGQAHYLAYFPYLKNIKEFSHIMEQYISNIHLSSQSTGLSGRELLKIVEYNGSILVPAHVFTPHKGFYGRACRTYQELFTDSEWDKIPAVELGLSADTYLADHLSELEEKTFLSNSDAHSLAKIAREYNVMKLKELNYSEFVKALKREEGRKITANYGLDPRMGKYYSSFCENCNKSFSQEYTELKCPYCQSGKVVRGVKDRILQIKSRENSISPEHRAEYIHQVPLRDLPGIGEKTYQSLLARFRTEMNIIHRVTEKELLQVVNHKIADMITQGRRGELEIENGGGGHYGKVMG